MSTQPAAQYTPRHRTTSPLDLKALAMTGVIPSANVSASRRNGELFITFVDGGGNTVTFVTGLDGQDAIRAALDLRSGRASSWTDRQVAV